MKLFRDNRGTAAQKEQAQFLSEMYKEYAGYLKRLAFTFLCDEASADDIVGEVFLHLAKNISRLQQYSSSQLRSYVVICTRGRSLNMLKKRASMQKHEESLYDERVELLELESSEPSVDIQVLKKIDMETASELLKKVTPTYRDAFLLKYQEGLGHEAIAEVLGVQPQSVKTYVIRAQKELRKLAIERGMVHE